MSQQKLQEFQDYRPRVSGRVNWIGVQTLYAKEVHRFMKTITQTVLAPMSTTLLFLAIFTLAFGDRYSPVPGITYAEFLAPGLIIMAVLQNSFANTSSSIMISKIQGNIVDVLMPPLAPAELVICYIAAGLTRGLVVALAVLAGMWLFIDFSIPHPLIALLYLSGGSLAMALIGMVAGVWAQKFDHLSAVTNFVITPLAFLSGTFYSIERLPEPWLTFAQFNPVFYMIDGFRYGFTGHSDSNLWLGAGIILLLDILLGLIAYQVFRSGWKLKA